MSTYGQQPHGKRRRSDPSTIFIPKEQLDLPSVNEDLPITWISAITAQQIKSRIIQLGAGAALTELTLNDIIEVVRSNGFAPDYLSDIANHELLARLYTHYDLAPTEPVDYLRYLIYRTTDDTLLIKNEVMIDKIKNLDPVKAGLLDELIAKAPDNLASIFYRFKPIFLALRSVSNNKTFFNRLRKQAVKRHQPILPDYLGSVTQQLLQERLVLSELKARTDQASIFRVIRLAYALDYRLQGNQSIVYPVRNGTGWASEFNWPQSLHRETLSALEVVVQSICNKIKHNVDGRKIYIPDYVHYALPLSEKQFAGPFPTGSYIDVPRDMVFGIHWLNVGEQQTDLDLSLVSASKKMGWDAEIRDGSVMFSGDITDAPAPDGATELFYLRDTEEPQLVLCNYYNYSAEHPVEATLIVANDAPAKLGSNYLIDPNKIVARIPVTISRRQNIVGLVRTSDSNRFYMSNISVGCGITSREDENSRHARNYLSAKFSSSTLDLAQIIEKAGGIVSGNSSEQADINLAPETLSQADLLELLR